MVEPQADSERWLLVIDPAQDGLTNMAKDLWLAQHAAMPALRLYTWRPWALSLGYHQPLEEVDLVRCREEGVDVVRRPTGGRAVLHAEELTYCVTVPAAHPWYRASVTEVYRRISTALFVGLRRLIPDLSTTSAGGERAYPRNPACFATSVRFEITVKGRKLVGSAQRRLPEGLLQHGSILLGPAHQRLARYFRRATGDTAAHAVSMSEVLARRISPDEAAEVVAAGFRDFFSVSFEPFHWTAAALAEVEKLREDWRRKTIAGAMESNADRTA